MRFLIYQWPECKNTSTGEIFLKLNTHLAWPSHQAALSWCKNFYRIFLGSFICESSKSETTQIFYSESTAKETVLTVEYYCVGKRNILRNGFVTELTTYISAWLNWIWNHYVNTTCTWRCFQKSLSGERRLILNVGDTIPWGRAPDWIKRKWSDHQICQTWWNICLQIVSQDKPFLT